MEQISVERGVLDPFYLLKECSLIYIYARQNKVTCQHYCSFTLLTVTLTLKQRMSYIYIYRVEQEECARLREGVPYVKVYRYNPKHLYPKLNGLGDNGN